MRTAMSPQQRKSGVRLSFRQIEVLWRIRKARKIELGRLYERIGRRDTKRTVVSLIIRQLIDFADGPPGRVVLTPDGKLALKGACRSSLLAASIVASSPKKRPSGPSSLRRPRQRKGGK